MEVNIHIQAGHEPTKTLICHDQVTPESKDPTLKRIAWDYLAIQGSTTASEPIVTRHQEVG